MAINGDSVLKLTPLLEDIALQSLIIGDTHTVQIANELSIFAGLVRDSCESNACEINAYSFANTRTFREVLHMNQSETRGPRTG